MRSRQARYTLLAVILAALFLAGLEGVARWYEGRHPGPAVDFDGGFSAGSRVFTEVPGEPGIFRTSETKRSAFVDQVFPRRKQPGALRIAVLGESSVNYLQEELWKLRPRLAAELHGRKIELINAGGKSYGSERLRIVARELLAYEPDVLVLYLGNNEFEEVEQLHLIRPRLAPLLSFFHHSALVRAATGLIFRARLRELRSRAPDADAALTYPFTDREVDERMARFEENLRAIVELYRGRTTRLILATIPSNTLRPRLPLASMARYEEFLKEYAAGNFKQAHRLGHELLRAAAGRHQSSDQENDILRRVAADNHLPLVEVEASVEAAEPHHIAGETLFRDHCHLNERGNELLAKLLERAIASRAKARQ